MIARFFLAAVLFTSVVAAQTGPPPEPLDTAETALVRALALPDRDAFRQLLAPDAVFLFPAEARGPEAIVEKWLPFLIDPALTLALTIETSATTESGEAGHTKGRFAINGRTNQGMRTTPAGTFAIEWRVVGGRWKIASLSGAGRAGIKLVRRGALDTRSFAKM